MLTTDTTNFCPIVAMLRAALPHARISAFARPTARRMPTVRASLSEPAAVGDGPTAVVRLAAGVPTWEDLRALHISALSAALGKTGKEAAAARAGAQAMARLDAETVYQAGQTLVPSNALSFLSIQNVGD